MEKINFIRRQNGVVTQKGYTNAEGLAAMQALRPGEYFAEAPGVSTPLPPMKRPDLPTPQPSPYPSVEELTDALLKHLDGDVSAFTAIRAKLKK